MAKYPKLFPLSKVEFQPNSTIKLTKKKIELITQKKEAQESSGEIAKSHHITWRRKDQLWKQYRDTGIIPIIGQTIGRPKKSITIEESITIDQAYQQYRYGAQMLEILIRKEYGIYVPYKQDSWISDEPEPCESWSLKTKTAEVVGMNELIAYRPDTSTGMKM